MIAYVHEDIRSILERNKRLCWTIFIIAALRAILMVAS